MHLRSVVFKPSSLCRLLKLEMRTGHCHRDKTHQGTHSPAAPRVYQLSTRTVRKLATADGECQPKKPRNHFCKGFSKEMKMFQIIRELSGFSLSSEQFNNDIKISIAFSFPFFPSSLQSFRRVFFHKSKYQKARKAQNQFASNAFTSSTYRERHTEPLAQQT